MHRQFLMLVLFLCLGTTRALAHVGEHPSVHDTVAGIIERMRKSPEVEAMRTWKPEQFEAFLTNREREILATEHIRFRVNVPVDVFIVQPKSSSGEVFWLREGHGFEKQSIDWTESGSLLNVYARRFPAGSVGLGVNSLTGGGNHYIVILKPAETGDPLQVTALYPGQMRTAVLTNGVRSYVDDDFELNAVPDKLRGLMLVQTQRGQRDAGKIAQIFRTTPYPAKPRPDQIVLTWSDDPKTTQTIQWRTSDERRRPQVRYARKRDARLLGGNPPSTKTVRANTEPLRTPNNVNDPLNFRHTAILRDLEPGTTYIYSVGDGSRDTWSEEAEFTTAPSETVPFSFIYMGDAQNGLDRWGSLLKNADRERPDAAFYIMAGDLVNRGADRDDWDSFFHNAAGTYNRKQLVPAIGNHECQGGHPSLYLKLFTLPENGPADVEKERAYWFEYSNALFVVLDSNLPADSQAEWLDRVLGQSKATWKFVTYHHPAYSSAANRDNKTIREVWTPIFDKHRVDMALQGHDHGYLRTYPMHGQEKAEPGEGTVYVVSVSGTKFYKVADRDYAAFSMSNVATYQVLDIQISGDRLLYRAYDTDGKLRDELEILKKAK